VRGNGPLGVDQVELAVLATGIVGQERFQDLCRTDALLQERESARTVEGVDQRLRRERSHAAVGVGAKGADREKSAGDDDAQRTVRITRDNRPRHWRLASGWLLRVTEGH
jgi:hypothetical protein